MSRRRRLERVEGVVGVPGGRCPHCPKIQIVDEGEAWVTHCPACGRPVSRNGEIAVVVVNLVAPKCQEMSGPAEGRVIPNDPGK